MSRDEKSLKAAEGYLELELAGPALEALADVSAPGREEFRYSFHHLSGMALRSLGKFAKAIEHLEVAQSERPGEVDVYHLLGWCYKRTDQVGQAIEALLEAHRVCLRTKDDSYLALTLYNLACYYSLDGQREKMLEALAAALEREPSFRDTIGDEADFDRYRDDPEFIRLTSVIV